MEKQESRAGLTRTTSVSVSKEFQEIMENYNLSPTEVFRKGMGVTLCDIGIERYKTPMNTKRLVFVKEFLGEFKKNDKMNKLFDKIAELALEIKELE